MLSVIMPNVVQLSAKNKTFLQCHYAKCCYAECHK
jgi:hypothetical protein